MHYWYFILLYIILQLPIAIADRRRGNFDVFSVEWTRWHRIYKVLKWLSFIMLIVMLILSAIELVVSLI